MSYSRIVALYRSLKDIRIFIPATNVNSDITKISGSIYTSNFRKQSDTVMLQLEVSVLFSPEVKSIAVTT